MYGTGIVIDGGLYISHPELHNMRSELQDVFPGRQPSLLWRVMGKENCGKKKRKEKKESKKPRNYPAS
jgi:hypothetical protein